MVGNGSCGNCCSPSLIDDSMGVTDDSGIRKCGIWKGSWEQATEMKNGRWTDETGLWMVVVSWWPAFLSWIVRWNTYGSGRLNVYAIYSAGWASEIYSENRNYTCTPCVMVICSSGHGLMGNCNNFRMSCSWESVIWKCIRNGCFGCSIKCFVGFSGLRMIAIAIGDCENNW